MIEIDARALRQVEMRLGAMKSKPPTAISRALDRTAINAKTNVSKKSREIYVIKSKDINQALKISRSSKGSLNVTLAYRGERIPLDKFKFSPSNPRPKKPPTLKVSVKKDGMKSLLHAFVADINGSKIFERVGKSRLPIGRLFGPAVPQIVNKEELRRFVEAEAEKTYEKRLDHEIKRVLKS